MAGGERREEPRVTFTAPNAPPWVRLDHLHRRWDRHNKAAWMTLIPPFDTALFPPLWEKVAHQPLELSHVHTHQQMKFVPTALQSAASPGLTRIQQP